MNMNGTGTKATRRRIWLDVSRFYPYGETLTLFPGKYANLNRRRFPNWGRRYSFRGVSESVFPQLGTPGDGNQVCFASNISANSERISSIAIFSRLTTSFSVSWSTVAFTEMSANLDGNRIDVSSQLKAE
jgi:hypothetical protein